VFIGLSLAFPVFIWMRPHWKDMLRLEMAAQRLGAGFLEERTHFDSASSLYRLGVAFNQMADNINTLIASKKQLIDNIAHELRTPLVRLRYRLAMSEGLSTEEQERLNHDVSQLEGLIDELLTFARLDRPQVTLNLASVDLPTWLTEKLADIRLVHSERIIHEDITDSGEFGQVDARLIILLITPCVTASIRSA
jgi:two-component system sensor histidine kinase RstB